MFGFFKQLWFGETRGVAKAALLVSVASFLSRLVGVLRDRVLASTFGASSSLDAYYAAFRLPDFIYNLLILGALTAGFIPVFTEYWEKKSPQEAWQLSEEVFSVIGCVLAFLGIGLFIAAPALVPLTVHGFSAETITLTITLTRIMCLSPLLLGLSAVMGGVLQSTRRLFAFALAPILYNLGIIAGARFLSPFLGVRGLAWGVVLGALLHFAVQASVTTRMGMRRIVLPSLKSPGVRRILSLMGPRTAGLAVTQVNLVILLSFASSLSAGSVSVFNLANNLQSFPIGIIGISFAIAAFPILSSAVSQGDDGTFRRVFSQTVNRIIFFMLPMTALLIVFRMPIVRLVLGEGKFDMQDTQRVALVLGWFAVSLVAQALIPLFARGFYALQNTWTPLWVSLLAEAVNLICAYFFREALGIAGLAAAFSCAAVLQLALLWWMLARRRPLDHRMILQLLLKMSLATVLFSLVLHVVVRVIDLRWMPHTFWQLTLQVCVAGVLGLLILTTTLSLLHIPEWIDLREKIKMRFTHPFGKGE